MTDTADRVRGTLLGLAAGDRIGGPVRMALCLARSLLDRGGFDEADVLGRYLAWWQAGGYDTGPVAEEVFALVAAGVPAEAAVRRVDAARGGLTAGCNPAHRSVPLAMAAFPPDGNLDELARREARLTHRHRLAGEAASACVRLCRLLIRGVAWEEALGRAAVSTEGPLSSGGFAPDVLRAAVRFVDAHGGFGEALGAALAFAGGANYCPVLAGALAGARWGASAVPVASIDAEVRDEADEVAGRMAEAWREA